MIFLYGTAQGQQTIAAPKVGDIVKEFYGNYNTDNLEYPRATFEKRVGIKNVNYLFKNQGILLDIIENLNGRKICFPNNFIDELKGLNDHLILKDGLYIYDN